MKIKIAHVAGGLTTGGVEAVVYNYFSHMPREDYELYYISYDTPNEQVKARFEALGFHVYEVCKKKDNFIKSCRQVLDILKENDIQIIHSHMTLVCFITAILARMCGVKVCIAHSHLAQNITGIKKYVYGVFKWLTKLTASDCFACGNEAGIYLYGKKAVENGQVVMMHNAIDIQKYGFCGQTRREVREELKAQDSFCIGHVGRFTEQKNHTFLLDIMSEIVKVKDNAKLFLFGEGPLEEEIREKVQRLSLQEHVVFMGSVTNMDRYYPAMDVFLLPSLYEGLAVSLVEAQCSGLPVVTSDTVTEEIKLSHKYDVLALTQNPAKWAQAVCKYEQSKESAERLEERQQAKFLIEEHGYNIQKEAEKIDRFYKNAVGQR